MTNPGYRSHKKMEGGLKIEGQKSWLMVGHRAELMISGDYSKEWKKYSIIFQTSEVIFEKMEV